MDPGLRRIFLEALAHHQAGRLSKAEALYLQIVAAEPDTPHALHLLGVIAQKRGCLGEAEQWFRKAISASDGPVAEFHNSLGAVLRARGELGQAVAPFEQAILLRPDYIEAHQDLGRTLLALHRPDEASVHFEKVLQLRPDAAAAHRDMGSLFMQKGVRIEARACFEKATRLDPRDADAWNSLGAVLYALGQSAEDRKLLDKAWTCYEKALEIEPHYADAWYNLSTARHQQGRLAEAIDCICQALVFKPGNALAYGNLGVMLAEQGKLTEAVAAQRHALELQPDDPSVHDNLGYTLKVQGRFSEAIACFDQALELDPNFVLARWNRSLTLFLAGQIERAWTEYECGWVAGMRKYRRPFRQPLWDGRPLAGRRLLFWGEQGVGDEIIWACMIPELGERLIVECEPRLVPLFARSFPAVEVIPRTDPPQPAAAQADLQIPAGSACRWLRGSLGQFPQHRGYLRADPGRVAYWRRRLDSLGPGLTVGIGWRSAITAGLRALSCTGLQQWGAVFAVPGIHFINLQYDECRAELEEARACFGVPIHQLSGIDLKQHLDDVAALVAALDLVISNGSTVANIAGALGKPGWVMELLSTTDWLTMGQNYIPWFPSLRLYARAHEQSQVDVLERVARDLADLASHRASSIESQPPSVPLPLS